MKKIIILVFFTFNGLFAQQNGPRYSKVILNVNRSLRIPHHDVSVEFKLGIRTNDPAVVHFVSNPLKGYEGRKHFQIDTTFTISREQYAIITDSVSKIRHKDFVGGQLGSGGFSSDGYTCSIEFGNPDTYSRFQMPSPNPNYTEERAFYNSCKLILETCGINPYDVIDEKPIVPEEVKKANFEKLRKMGIKIPPRRYSDFPFK